MATSTLRKRMPVSALTDPKIVVPAIGSAFAKLDPRVLMKNPVMFVVEVVAALTTVIFLRDLATGGENLGFTFQIIVWLWFTVLFANFAEAVAEGRGKAQAEFAPAHAHRDAGEAPHRRRPDEVQDRAGHEPQGRRHRAGRGRRHHPVGRRGDRRRRLGQRGGHHRRVGAGDPRERRRPLGGHRRHAGDLGLDHRAHHRGSGRDLPRPHDRAGRGRRAAEDAERDRAQHPARRHDPDLRVRDGDHPELRPLCGRHGPDRGRGGAVRDADPDDHRRAALRHRHRRDGPSDPLQRARDVGPLGRGGRRRRHAAARQDRHDHARQPPGDGVPAAGRRDRAGARRRGSARLASGRNARGSLDRRARQAEIRAARARDGAAPRPLRSFHRADAHERRRHRRQLDPQGRRRRDPGACRA